MGDLLHRFPEADLSLETSIPLKNRLTSYFRMLPPSHEGCELSSVEDGLSLSFANLNLLKAFPDASKLVKRVFSSRAEEEASFKNATGSYYL